MKELTVRQVQDSENNWFWIPLEELEDFRQQDEEITGKDYLDAPDDYDYFENSFSKYATGGDIGIKPEYFVGKDVFFDVERVTLSDDLETFEVWNAASELRFVERDIPDANGMMRSGRILQQKWIDLKGKVEWTDVPLVKLGDDE